MKPVKMMVVDDEQDVSLLFKQKFRKEIRKGLVHIHFAHSGEDAINYLKTLEPFDLVLVLSDINMPGMTGLELLKAIKSDFPDLTVFMVTAYGDEENFTKAKTAGANDFITKPVDFKMLKEKILNYDFPAPPE